MTKYLSRSKHSEVMADGASFAPGSEVELTKEQEAEPHYERMIREQVLVPVEEQTPPPPDPPNPPEETQS